MYMHEFNVRYMHVNLPADDRGFFLHLLWRKMMRTTAWLCKLIACTLYILCDSEHMMIMSCPCAVSKTHEQYCPDLKH